MTDERDKMIAGVAFIEHTGATSFQLRYSDEDQPVVWFAVAGFEDERWEADASLNPYQAVLRLCERLADGGRCAHCGRVSGLEANTLDTMPLSNTICWWQYDPELKKFRRGCE